MQKSTDKYSMNRTRSASLLIKQKISIALGKTSQSKQKNSHKNNITSYLNKQRSNSLKSLGKTKTLTNKQPSKSIKKLIFVQQTPKKHNQTINTKNKEQYNQHSRINSSFKSHRNSVNLNQEHDKKQTQLVWLDSNERKLKIVQKNIRTLQQEAKIQKCTQYVIIQNSKQQKLAKMQDNKLLITTNFSIFVGKYDIKTKKEEILKIPDKQLSIALKFQGFIYVFSSSKHELNIIKQMFGFIINQFEKLREDGLRQYDIIFKIMKRLFQQKYPFKSYQYFIFLLHVQNLNNPKTKILDTQKLISQKLLCIQKVTQTTNLKNKNQSSLNKNIFFFQ